MKPLGAWKQARRIATWRAEVSDRLGIDESSVERITATLAPAARAAGGTEGDCLAILRHVALVNQVTRGDVDQIIEDTLDAWASAELEGVNGVPLASSMSNTAQAEALTLGAIKLVLPMAFERWATARAGE